MRRRGGSRVSHPRVKARARTRGLRLVVGGLSGSAGGAGRGAAQAAEARLPRALREWLLEAKKAGAALAHRSAVVESLLRSSQKRQSARGTRIWSAVCCTQYFAADAAVAAADDTGMRSKMRSSMCRQSTGCT